MILSQDPYTNKVASLLEGKENVAQDIGTERFLYLIIAISIVFLFTSLMMTIIMIIHRKVHNRMRNEDKAIRSRFQDFLSGFLLLPVDDAFIGIQQNQNLDTGLEHDDIKKKKKRMILAEEMYQLQKDLSGQQKIQLTNYFLGIGLQNDVRQLIKSRNWAKQVKGVQMIKGFELSMFSAEVDAFILSDNMDLSIEAIVAKIHIDKNLNALEKIDRALTDWEMHKIYCASINDRKLVSSLRKLALKEESVLKPINEYLPQVESEELIFA